MTEAWLTARDGTRLCYHVWPGSEKHDRAVVVIAHGIGEHGRRYAPLAEALHPIGCSVYAPDHRGHGRSEGQRGHVERFDDWVDDLAQVIGHVRRPRHPIFVIGHSGGGLIALRYLIEHAKDIRGIILSSPLLGISVPIPPLKLRLGRLLARVVPRLTLRSGVDPMLVSHDQALVDRYASDPLVHDRISLRLFGELEEAMAAALRDADRLTLPILILQAGDDRIVSVESTKRLYATLGSTDKTLTVYDGWFHEVFNEVDRQRAYEEVARWIGRHLD